MKYGNRSVWKKIVSSPLTLIPLLIIFGLLTKATWSIHKKSQISREKLDQTAMALQKLEERKNELSQKVTYLSTDEGIKSEIRNKFRAVEGGESVAVIIDQNQFATTTATSSKFKRSAWGKVLSFFGI